MATAPAEGCVRDIDDLRVELAAAVDELLELADRLADLTLTQVGGPTAAAKLAREYQEKRLDAKWLRRAIAVEVAG